MQKLISLKLKPNEAFNDAAIKEYLAASENVAVEKITGFNKIRQSIDARNRSQIWYNITLNVFINEPFYKRTVQKISFKNVHHANKKVIIVGAGPAGLFAALKLLEHGVQPIIVERGKDVRARRKDLAILNRQGIINPESNYCFGEGGAGAYSDGKLYTRSNKRGNVERILNLLFQFGADEKILYEAHPHIGTNKLPHIITSIRQQIIDCGGMVLFENKVVDFILKDDEIIGIINQHNEKNFADAVILATGHSARDIFELLHNKKIFIEAKPFALGVRVEHPQSLIDGIQYHLTSSHSKKEEAVRSKFLPPSSYSFAEQINNKGVFSFCMCPGGIIAPAATQPNELVVNGWSPSKRNNPFANSGIVVSVDEQSLKSLEFKNLKIESPLALMNFQKTVEQKAYAAGGGNFVAPAMRMVDFCENKISSTLPPNSYLPGICSANLQQVLPDFIFKNLQQAFKIFGKKMKGYYTNDAVVVATESRTSSPVRIPRNAQTLQHVQIKNLYPCGEGAGYAGGIVSAAMDGEKVAEQIVSSFPLLS